MNKIKIDSVEIELTNENIEKMERAIADAKKPKGFDVSMWSDYIDYRNPASGGKLRLTSMDGVHVSVSTDDSYQQDIDSWIKRFRLAIGFLEEQQKNSGTHNSIINKIFGYI